MINKNKLFASAVIFGAALLGNSAFAACPTDAGFPSHADLKAKLTAARNANNGGFNLDMWATIVTRGGVVCDVVYTGKGPGDQWPGSRVISAQKANTANAFSLPGLALSTANLYTATQPGGSLFGLQESNPVNVAVAYAGKFNDFGSAVDPLIGQRIGGINVFGGGLALYKADGTLIGGIGVSGDSSCADHNIAWRTRKALGLDKVPGGVGPNGTDGIDYTQTSGWAHPVCSPAAKTVATNIGAGA
jgi:uncharacterized protein GlcG (DUF336 family)